MLPITRSFRIALALVLVLSAGRATAADAPVSAKMLRGLRADTRRLTRALEDLQAGIVQDLAGARERLLYRKADAALTGAVTFERSLKEKATAERLEKGFRELDAKVSALLKDVAGLPSGARALQREAARVEAATEEIEFSLTGASSSPEQRSRVLKRQTRRLFINARELERTAQYALRKEAALSAGDFRNFVEAVAMLQKGANAGASLEQLRKDYAKVNAAWQKIVGVLKRVKPADNLYLYRIAVRADRMLDRMHRLLGVRGKHPGIIVRT